jgi:ribosomal protein S18 acetylase RimI-like enzyme
MSSQGIERVIVRAVERFDEPEYRQRVESIFHEDARVAGLPIAESDRQRLHQLRTGLPQPRMLRIGAYDEGVLVGWSVGRFHKEGTFTIDNSAVLPPYRRRGLYTIMAREMIRAVSDTGAQVIHSLHRADNNPILIAKLKLGFVIAGMQFSEEFGLLVRTVFHLDPARRDYFARRAGESRAETTG